MARKPKEEKAPGRVKQLGMVAKIVHRANPKALPTTIAIALAVAVVVVAIGAALGQLAFAIPFGILVAAVVALFLFGRYAQSAQYSMLDGQTGASVAILENMRGNWTVERAVAANRNMDVVHRVVGRPGVVLVGEGSPRRLASLLAAEKKRVSRVAYDVPIYDLQVGDEDGQVPLRKLQGRMMKLPRNLKGDAVSEINYRLKALPANLRMPKGPMPKNVRMPKGPKPRMR